MPVIKPVPTKPVLSPERRQALLKALSDELSGRTMGAGPVIFEIPFEEAGKIEPLVVWDQWEGVRPIDRTKLIYEAYGEHQETLGQAVGVTRDEAMQDDLLPYEVLFTHDFPKYWELSGGGEAGRQKVQMAMIEEGATRLPDGRVELRCPTKAMADAACNRLREKLPTYASMFRT
jgi:hypothetical protein